MLLRLIQDLVAMVRLPEVTIDLMREKTEGNDPFYGEVVEKFYREATAPHPRLRFIGAQEVGVAVCRLPESPDTYLRAIEAAGRRNIRKAQRAGYRFERIEYNRHLADIAEIRRSAEVRQGRVPDEFLAGAVSPVQDPPSRTRVHDYVYFGVLRGEQLVAYAGVFVAGEAAMLEQVLGHAQYQPDGIVPLLLAGIVETLLRDYPRVRYFVYGTWFGAGPTLRRFKHKFGFRPCRVRWALGA